MVVTKLEAPFLDAVRRHAARDPQYEAAARSVEADWEQAPGDGHNISPAMQSGLNGACGSDLDPGRET